MECFYWVWLILATLTLTFDLNNVILLINFLSILLILGFQLFLYNCIEITLFIVLIYSSALLCLFLVSGLLLMSSLSFNYRNLCSSLLINNWEISLWNVLMIRSELVFVYLFQSIRFLSLLNFLFVCFPCSLSLFINLGFNRVGNLVFDNSLFHLIVLIFYVTIVNIKSLIDLLISYSGLNSRWEDVKSIFRVYRVL